MYDDWKVYEGHFSLLILPDDYTGFEETLKPIKDDDHDDVAAAADADNDDNMPPPLEPIDNDDNDEPDNDDNDEPDDDDNDKPGDDDKKKKQFIATIVLESGKLIGVFKYDYDEENDGFFVDDGYRGDNVEDVEELKEDISYMVKRYENEDDEYDKDDNLYFAVSIEILKDFAERVKFLCDDDDNTMIKDLPSPYTLKMVRYEKTVAVKVNIPILKNNDDDDTEEILVIAPPTQPPDEGADAFSMDSMLDNINAMLDQIDLDDKEQQAKKVNKDQENEDVENVDDFDSDEEYEEEK
jgi:hypothetical protein